MQWTKDDAIEFCTNNSRIEIVCGKCHGMIYWWPISTEQVALLDEHRTKIVNSSSFI